MIITLMDKIRAIQNKNIEGIILWIWQLGLGIFYHCLVKCTLKFTVMGGWRKMLKTFSNFVAKCTTRSALRRPIDMFHFLIFYCYVLVMLAWCSLCTASPCEWMERSILFVNLCFNFNLIFNLILPFRALT